MSFDWKNAREAVAQFLRSYIESRQVTASATSANQAQAQELRARFGSRQSDIEAVWRSYATMSRASGPCDRGAAEVAVMEVYKANGEAAPLFLWFDSPAAAVVPMLLWCLFENMLRIAEPSPENRPVLCQWAESGELSHAPALSEKFLQASRQSEEPRMRVELDTMLWNRVIWQEFGDDHREEVTAETCNRFHRELRAAKPLDVWIACWEAMAEKLRATPSAFYERWQQAGDILWSLNDADQYALIDASSAFLETAFRTTVRSGAGDCRILLRCAILETVGFETAPGFASMRSTLTTCGWWWARAGICFMIERPISKHYDANGDLHMFDRPALEYADKTGLYAIRGLVVTEDIACGRFSAQDIADQDNLELRRVMIERYGFDRYLKETGAMAIHHDACGVLYLKEMPGDEPIALVKVINSTPEADGSFKEYFLRVPPNMRSAREAIAWTFGLTEFEYKPKVET